MHDLERQILEYVSHAGYKPSRPKALAKQLRVGKDSLREFRESLERLTESGRLTVSENGMVRPKSAPGLLAGIVKRKSSGGGIFIPHEAPDGAAHRKIQIPAGDMRDAHTGDEVLVQLSKRRHSGGMQTGRIEQILERATNIFVGTYFEREGQGFVQVDGGAISDPVTVGDPGAKGAQADDKVVIEMLRFPSQWQPGEGVLTKVLGPRGEPGVDLLSIIHEFRLPDEFPEAVLEEARLQAQQFDENELGDRLDLTGETIITIDPVDARDFDDAISLSRTKDGHWHLGVHIADVSHFVTPGSVLDREAQLRGNSVYLPQRVLPMLPEILSNALASLQQGKVRYTKSALIEFSPEGTPLHTRFANSAIRVTRRFAYEEVMPILREPERFRTRVGAKVRKLLSDMYELAMILRRRRMAAGALELTMPEVKLDFDKEGKVSGAHQVEHDESHQIIEEFMLAANVATATELAARGIPFMRRSHASPDFEKLRAFSEFVSSLGYSLKRSQSRTDLQALLDEVRGKPEERAINYALLRSMKQAEYTGAEIGHYALAEEHYCHFTSPIRRYPDLTVHRLIASLVAGEKKPRGPNEADLIKLGKQCSVTERRADRAERELTKVKLLTYLQDQIGMELDAVITGVERFGVFCLGTELPAEGLIHITTLPGDYYDFDAVTHSLVGRRAGQTFRLGDRLRVSVGRVDVDRRELDFRIVAVTSRRPAAAKKRSPGAEGDGAEPSPERPPRQVRSRTSAVNRGKSRRKPR